MTRSRVFIGVAVLASAIAATLSAQAPQGSGANAQVTFPKITATTPSACLNDVKAYSAERRKELPAPGTAMSPQERNALAQQINASTSAMTKACAAQFDPTTVEMSQLAPAIQLFGDAAMLDKAQTALDRALPMKTMSPADRAAVIVAARAPAGTTRSWRVANLYPKVEALIDELDANSAATFEQKWAQHTAMESQYRGDDIDAGIIKHGNWITAAAAKFTPEDRKKYGGAVVSAHVNMAEAYAGQGMNDKALKLLEDARKVWGDVPRAEDMIGPPLARYQIVGTPGAAIAAPVWLNAPAGTKELAMPGQVTLLEFTAHWCGPCRESYPGINRLRERFKGQSFRVVMATRLWGYFGVDRIPGDAELAHDKEYFAEHKLDVPVAIGLQVTPSLVDGKLVYKPGPDPNDEAYRVGGIPQIHLIDKKGNIRLIMVGYDNTNEEKMAKMIEALLKEK